MKENRLRELLRKGEPTLGTRMLIPWPGVIEIIGYTGLFDYVEFLGEYAPYHLHDLDNFARACELAGLSSMIKIDQEPRVFIAQRAIAAGIQNLLFADIRTVEDAEQAVKAVRAEPKGINGVRVSRGFGYLSGEITVGDLVKIYDDAVIAIMVEKKSTVENLEEILSVDGIDMVQFGPADYSLSIGLPGQRNHPKVKEAEERTIKTALRMGVAPRAEIRTPEEADWYIKLGVRNFSLNTDIRILQGWLRENGERLRKTLSQL